MSLPNALSVFRLAAAPGLLGLAWSGSRTGFLVLLAAALLSDLLDGLIARALGEVSEIGTRLDSWGDLATYLCAALGGWWLWRELARSEGPFLVLAVAGFTVPLVVGLIKFGRLPSYHTWVSKASAVALGVTAFALVLLDVRVPFHLAVGLQLLAGCEEVAITAVLPEWRANVPTLRHALQATRGAGEGPSSRSTSRSAREDVITR